MSEGKKGKIYRVNLNDENGMYIYYAGSRVRVEQETERINEARYGGPLKNVRVTYEEVPKQDITKEIRKKAESNGKALYHIKTWANDDKRANSAIKEIDPDDTSDIKYGKYGKVRDWLNKKRMQRRRQKLNARDLEGALSVITLAAGFLFLSPGITGKAIAGIAVKSSSFLGAGLIIVGLIAGLFWVRSLIH